MHVWPTVFNLWHSGTLALNPERQSARMSQIKIVGYAFIGAEHFEVQPHDDTGL